MRFGISGAETLAVRGRKSGSVELVPVIPVEHSGERYLVSPRGESDWVRNLRAAGGEGELGRRGRAEPFRSTELPVADRPPIIDTYRVKAGRAVASHLDALPDPADHPVFLIQPR